MTIPCSQRPLHNGSSGSTVEVLLGLTIVGASVLTAYALLPWQRRREQPDEDEPSRKKDQSDDADERE